MISFSNELTPESAFERAARDLPENYELIVEVERGALSISINDLNGKVTAFENDGPLDETIDWVVAWAIEDNKKYSAQ